MDEKFGKKYKLCSQKKIELLFEDGGTEKSFPFVIRFIFTELETPKNFQIAISVPKRKFRRAVDRNRIKRLIREAVRKKKYILEQQEFPENKKLALFLIYTSSKEESFQFILDKIEILFQRLVKESFSNNVLNKF